MSVRSLSLMLGFVTTKATKRSKNLFRNVDPGAVFSIDWVYFFSSSLFVLFSRWLFCFFFSIRMPYRFKSVSFKILLNFHHDATNHMDMNQMR